MSTKTDAIMDLLASGQRNSVASEDPRLDVEELPPSLSMSVLSTHVVPQHLADEARNARLSFCSLHAHPTGNVLIESDRDVPHGTRLVEHEVRGNVVSNR